MVRSSSRQGFIRITLGYGEQSAGANNIAFVIPQFWPALHNRQWRRWLYQSRGLEKNRQWLTIEQQTYSKIRGQLSRFAHWQELLAKEKIGKAFQVQLVAGWSCISGHELALLVRIMLVFAYAFCTSCGDVLPLQLLRSCGAKYA